MTHVGDGSTDGGGRVFECSLAFLQKRPWQKQAWRISSAEGALETRMSGTLSGKPETEQNGVLLLCRFLCWCLVHVLCCGFVPTRYYPHSCGWSSLHLWVGPWLQEFLQEVRLAKEGSAFGEVVVCLVSTGRFVWCQSFEVALWVYLPCCSGVCAVPLSDWALRLISKCLEIFCTLTSRNFWKFNCCGSLCCRWCLQASGLIPRDFNWLAEWLARASICDF